MGTPYVQPLQPRPIIQLCKIADIAHAHIRTEKETLGLKNITTKVTASCVLGYSKLKQCLTEKWKTAEQEGNTQLRCYVAPIPLNTGL